MPRKRATKKHTTRGNRKRKAIHHWLAKATAYLGRRRQAGKGLLDEILMPEIKDSKFLSTSSQWAADNALGFIPGVGNIARGIGYLGAAGLGAAGYGRRRRKKIGRGFISDAVASRPGQKTIGAIASFFG